MNSLAPIHRTRPLLRTGLFLLAALPAVYILIAIQYSAITVPFWDHTELIKYIAAWHDGSFRFSSLWEPHNQTRPLVYRTIMGFNAILTDWDIRSEYIYIYLALYSTFACHFWAIHRVVGDSRPNIVYPVTLSVVSLILFSPVGHNNHWWSMMFQLDAANLFIAFGLLIPFISPRRWVSHILGVVSCWLASYTLTNGLFAMATVAFVFQLSAIRPLKPNRWSLFWGGNLLVLLVIYLPGIALSTNATHPTMLQMAEFCLAYVGAPLGGLLWFPDRNMFDLPLSITANAACGAVLLTSCAVLCWHARMQLRERHRAALILFGFAIFSIASAVATGWGRATFDKYGLANANASRYTIFGAYLMLGQIYYVSAGFAQSWWNDTTRKIYSRYVILPGLTVFVLLSLVSYSRAIKVYKDAHQFNKTLVNAYSWGLQPTAEDKFIHPNPESIQQLKKDLQRLELGPYANRPRNQKVLPVGEFKKVGLLSHNRQITQCFTATEDGLKDMAVTMVTPNGKANEGVIKWQVMEGSSAKPVAQGTLQAADIHDWEAVRIKLPYLGNSNEQDYRLTLSATAADAQALGVALYASVVRANITPAIPEPCGTFSGENLSMNLTVGYAE